ncbi:MAG: DUF6069 family protein [Aeromicrobium sp.]
MSGSRLWAGGAATAVVAALVAVVGLLVARGILDIAVMAPAGDGTWHTPTVVGYAIAAAAGALLATAVMHGLLLFAPTPRRFFHWIMGLAAVVGVAWPFALDATLEEQIATALIDLAIVLAIASLVSGAADRSQAPPQAPHRSPRPGDVP